MSWAAFSSVFLVATFKFLFSPFAGIPLGLDFLSTFFAAISGATISSIFFYSGAEIFLKISKKNKLKKEKDALAKGIIFKPKKKFTRGNKLTIKLKRTFGKIGLCFLAPSLLSIPVGTIIVAKFYGREKDTFLWIFIGIIISGLISTSFAYFVFAV